MEHVANWVKEQLKIPEVRSKEDMRRVVMLLRSADPKQMGDFGRFFADRQRGDYFDVSKKGKRILARARYTLNFNEHMAKLLEKLLEGELHTEEVENYLKSLHRDKFVPKAFVLHFSILLSLLYHLGVISKSKEKGRNIYRLKEGKEDALKFLIDYLRGETD